RRTPTRRTPSRPRRSNATTTTANETRIDADPTVPIIRTFTFEGEPDGVALERLQLEDLPGGRCRLVGTSLTDSFEARDAMLVSGMDVGVREGYERLDELLAG